MYKSASCRIEALLRIQIVLPFILQVWVLKMGFWLLHGTASHFLFLRSLKEAAHAFPILVFSSFPFFLPIAL